MKKILNNIPKNRFQNPSAQKFVEILEVNRDIFFKTVKCAEKMYNPIRLRKKDGVSFRVIQAPEVALKTLQRLILHKILVTVPLPSYVYGFGPGKSIIENATLHRLSPYLLNIDLKDFFPSVHYKKVQKLYTELGLSPELALALTRLTTLEKALPQGAPTSPYLASLVLSSMDERLKNLCTQNRLKYSRYFDDITISGGERAHLILPKLKEIVQSEGYEIHTSGDKIRTPGPGEVRTVTGITIDSKGRLEAPNHFETEKYLKRLLTFGLSALDTDDPEKEKASLYGKINFIRQVNKGRGSKLMKIYNKIEW